MPPGVSFLKSVSMTGPRRNTRLTKIIKPDDHVPEPVHIEVVEYLPTDQSFFARRYFNRRFVYWDDSNNTVHTELCDLPDWANREVLTYLDDNPITSRQVFHNVPIEQMGLMNVPQVVEAIAA